MVVAQCLECVFKVEQKCYVKNDGSSTTLKTMTPCSSRELKHTYAQLALKPEGKPVIGKREFGTDTAALGRLTPNLITLPRPH